MSKYVTMRSYKIATVGPQPIPQGTEVLLRFSDCGASQWVLDCSGVRFDMGEGQFMELSKSVQLPRTLGELQSGCCSSRSRVPLPQT